MLSDAGRVLDCSSGVNDTGEEFLTGINETGEACLAGDNNTNKACRH
jgi:hypothetical protein